MNLQYINYHLIQRCNSSHKYIRYKFHAYLGHLYIFVKKILAPPIRFIFLGQTLWLSAGRSIFWEEKKMLIVSDLHFGKAGHFRKSGIGIPQNIFKEDLQRLFSEIQFFNPALLLITGDFFHSSLNKELNFFIKWRNDIPHVSFVLVLGNHDILPAEFYDIASIEVFKKVFLCAPFCFTHEPGVEGSENNNGLYTIAGHLHPGVRLSGTGHQSILLPCFYFGKKYAVLPAFSAFTGLAKIKISNSDSVFCLVNNQVIKVQ